MAEGKHPPGDESELLEVDEALIEDDFSAVHPLPPPRPPAPPPRPAVQSLRERLSRPATTRTPPAPVAAAPAPKQPSPMAYAEDSTEAAWFVDENDDLAIPVAPAPRPEPKPEPARPAPPPRLAPPVKKPIITEVGPPASTLPAKPVHDVAEPRTLRSQSEHDASTILSSLVAELQPTRAAQTRASEPPAPPTADLRLAREASALATTYPTRAALVESYRARIAVDRYGDLDGAEALCASAAAASSDSRCVAMTRRWIASKRGDRALATAAALAEVPLSGDPVERAGLLWHVATLTPPEHAEPTLRSILELDPQDLAAWLALAASAMRRGHWPAVAEAWDAIGSRTDDPAMRAACHASAGGIRDAHLNDLEGSRKELERAIEADPTSSAAHAGLQSIYLRTRQAVELARMVGMEARRVGDHDPALAYHECAGDLLWECARDSAEATRAYSRAAKLAPADVVPLGKLASLFEQEGRFVELVEVYELLLQRLADPVRRGSVLLRLGTIYETRLDRPEDALRCYRQALDAVPTLAPAAYALASLLQSQRRYADAAGVLLGEVDRLADPALRAARYVAIAELLETHAGSGPRVIALHERALSLDPGQTAALDALDRLHRASGRWDEIIALHEAQLGETGHPIRLRALRIALAALYQDRANAPEKAAEQLRQALASPVHDDSAPFHLLSSYARALADAGKWTEHVAVLEQQANLLGNGVELVATLYRIATVIENRLGDPARAIGAYERVLSHQPRHELALQAVLRLHASQSRWEEVIATERRLLELVERPEEAAVILHRIALVAEDHLSRPDDAIEAYEEALRYVPSYRPSRIALERLLRASARFDRLAQLLEEQAASAAGQLDRARLLAQAALVREVHGGDAQHGDAARLYDEALALEPSMPTALWGLYRIRVQAMDWRAASVALGAIVRQAKHAATRSRLLVQMARIHELRLDEGQLARELYDEALAADGGPTTICERLRIALERADDAVHWLEEAARATTDPKLVFAMHRLRATWIEQAQLGDAGDAYATAMQHGTSPAVLDGLARCSSGALLADALGFRARQLKDPATRALLHGVAGALHLQPDAADAAFRDALAAQPDFVPAIEGRRAIAERANDWPTAAAMTARMAEVCVHPQNQVELYETAAALYVDKLSDEGRGIELYRHALAIEPGREPALGRTLDLYERAGEWSQATTLIAEQLGSITDEARRADLLARRAMLLAERLGDGAAAIAELDRALVLRPGDPQLLMTLATLHESLGHWSDAARVYEQLAHVGGENGRYAALLAQARIWTVEVPDYPRAQRILEEALQLAPSDRDVLTKLADIAARAGDTKRSAELYEMLAARGTASERIAALIAAVELRRQLGDPAARDALAPAFALAFEDPAVIPLIEAHYRLHGELERFVAHAEAALGATSPNAEETAPLQVALGRIFARELAAPDRAIPYLRAAVASQPDAAELRIALATALTGREDAMAIAELRRAIELEPTSPIPYERMAAICNRLGWHIAGAIVSSAAALLGDDDTRARTPQPSTIGLPIANALPPQEALAMLVGQTRVPDVRRVVEMLDPFIHEIFPEHQDELRAAAPLPDTYPIVGVVRAIAAALGAPALPIYWRERSEPLLLASDPRAFVLAPEHVSEEATPRIRFDAGYAIARVAGGSILGHAAPPDQVRSLLLAIDDRDSDDEHNFRKRISSAMPRRSRKELERVVAESRIDVNAYKTWEQEERRRALGIGVITCGDLRAVATSISPEVLEAASAKERRERVKANPMLVDALRFATSDLGWSLARRLYGRL